MHEWGRSSLVLQSWWSAHSHRFKLCSLLLLRVVDHLGLRCKLDLHCSVGRYRMLRPNRLLLLRVVGRLGLRYSLAQWRIL
jgi:hypothetical protein